MSDCLPGANSNSRENLVGMPEYGIVEGSWEHRMALELAEKMGQRGAPLTWDVRGQYPPEVRALAEELAGGR